MAESRKVNGVAEWWNHDNDPKEQEVLDFLRLQNMDCGNYGYHHHAHVKGHPIGTALMNHHHHDLKCIFQAGINSLASLVESQRRQIADVNDAMDQIHRIARRLGTDKAREICADVRRY